MNTSRCITDEELPLFCLEHHFSLASTFYAEGLLDTIATCDLVVRDMPPHRNFLMAGGLEAISQFLQNLHYGEEQVTFLLESNLITPEFADYLRTFSFSGDVYALPEGTVHFPGEPLLRVTAPLIEATLITDQLMLLANTDTILLTKMARLQLASGDAICSVGTVRGQGIDAGWRLIRGSTFFDSLVYSSASTAFRNQTTKKKRTLNANHAFIKAFPSELEAMRAITRQFPGEVTVMIDTYDPIQGIHNAITVANELRDQGKSLAGITIDSGDLVELSKYARQELDKAGHTEATIVAAGNLDEYRISKLLADGIQAKTFLAVTEIVTSADAPKLEIVYKTAELEQNGVVRHTAKLTPGKLSLPGKKQVFRTWKNGIIDKDIIGLEDENLGEPLLKQIFDKGTLVYQTPSVDENKAYVREQLASLPPTHREIFSEYPSPLEVSEKITDLITTIRAEHVPQ